MIFNTPEQKEIDRIASKDQLVSRLWHEYKELVTDPAKVYHTALTKAIVHIADQIKEESLDIEDAFTKSILKLAESGEKVFATLEIGKKLLSPLAKEQIKSDTRNKKHEGKAVI